jgi:hypothetical protein
MPHVVRVKTGCPPAKETPILRGCERPNQKGTPNVVSGAMRGRLTVLVNTLRN